MKQRLLKIAGILFLILGGVGLFVPVWPTTPFVIVSAGCLSCAPKMRARIMGIPFFRAHIDNYVEKSGLSGKSLVVSFCYLWGMLGFSMALTANTPWFSPLLCAVGIAVSVHLLFVASPRRWQATINMANTTLPQRAEDSPADSTDPGQPAPAPAARPRNRKILLGVVEAVFDTLYLCIACYIGVRLLSHGNSVPLYLAGLMALVLAGGDAFHLLPRIAIGLGANRERLQNPLGTGKAVTSVTMTVFYMLLWHIGLLLPGSSIPFGWTVLAYGLALIRILLCLMPQNRWQQPNPSPRWSILRNVPFFLLGAMASILFAIKAPGTPALAHMWLAIAISFACYAPVALFSGKHPALGSLMLPKSLAYLWMLSMFLAL